ncbi:MAG: histidinol-phosphate transaminase [Nitrospinaceae bacterium]
MTQVDITSLIRNRVKSLKAYQVENFDCAIKLHANENAFPPPGEIMTQLAAKLRQLPLNRYPDPDSRRLKEALGARLNQSPDRMMIGNGSDELIQILLQIFCDPGDAVAFPDPTFAMYAILSKGMGLQPVPYPLDEGWDFDASSFLQTIAPQNPRMVFFSYPNNPTGNCFQAEAIKEVLREFPGIVVLDEAYHDFSRLSFLPELETHNNLIVLRSLSKIGLAGLRVGYGIAAKEIIHEVDKIRLPYNSNMVSQAFCETVLENFEPVQQQIDLIIKERDTLLAGLSGLPGVTAYPSAANFILFRIPADSTGAFNELVSRGVLVRDLSGHPRLRQCLRVTVGTPEENSGFLQHLETVLR